MTGAASGFGRGIAQRFVAEGARVAVVDINADGARDVAASLGSTATAIHCDVSDSENVHKAVENAVATFGGLDVVVNNAGVSHRNKPMLDVTEDEYDRIFAINVKSIYLMSLVTVPLLRQRGGGSILNIGSTAGVRPRPGLAWYNASKGAVNLVSKSMAVELAPDKIRVNCIAPVMGETPLLETFMGQPDTPEVRAKFISTIPWGRMSQPEDIANAAVFLASDEADMVTGTILQVDGGRCV